MECEAGCDAAGSNSWKALLLSPPQGDNLEVPHVRLAELLRSICDLGAEVKNKHESQTLSVRSLEKMLLNMSSTFPLKLQHTIQFLRRGVEDYRQTVNIELRSSLELQRGTSPLRWHMHCLCAVIAIACLVLITMWLWGAD